MRRAAVLVVVVAMAVAALVALPGAPADCTRVQDHSVPLPPGVSVPDPRVRVLLPTAYCDGDDRYPVLLLLHGAGDTWQTWTANTDVEVFSEAFDVIVVMPDGGRNSEAGWYSDWADGSRQWETFHTDVLVEWVDSSFRTLGDGHRAVAGLSMGGFGAMSYAARHPGLFDAAASFSGAVDTMMGWPLNGFGFELAHDQFGTPDDRVWGDHITDADDWRAHNPTDQAAALAGVEVFLATGTGTPGGPAGDDPGNPGGYVVEQAIWQMNREFVQALDGAGVDYNPNGGFDPSLPHATDWSYVGGYHGWPYWEATLHWALPQIVEVIGGGGETAPGPPGRAVADERKGGAGAGTPAEPAEPAQR